MSRKITAALLLVSCVTLSTGKDASAQGNPHREPCGTTGDYGVEDAPGNAFDPDPLLDKQWALDQMDVHEAWGLGVTGKHVTIALVDTGVDLTHPDLDGNLLEGIDLHPQDGECPGAQANEVPTDGHGTFSAGLLVAEAGNGIGIAGVAHDAELIPIEATEGWATSTTGFGLPFYPVEDPDAAARVALAIDYAVENKADVILLEVGLSPLIDPSIEQAVGKAIARAWGAGAVIVAPAVNSSAGTCFYPASDPHVLCAAATDHQGRPAYYSGLLASPTNINALRAPGGFGWERPEWERSGLARFCNDENIWSTAPAFEGWGCEGAAYDAASGTSWSAAHVAGVAALLAGTGADNTEILECLTSTAFNPVTERRGIYDPIYGYGIVDADDALQACNA